jgi:hyperosmotically inducible protein
MKPKGLVRSLALWAALIAPAAPIPLRAASKPTTDDYISDNVRQKLAADQVVKGGDLEITVKDGVVTMNGKVHEQKQKDKAEHIAKRVNGVKSVVNNLKIEKP